MKIVAAAEAWKKAGDEMAIFRQNPNFDHVLTQEDREKLQANFRAAVENLIAAVDGGAGYLP